MIGNERMTVYINSLDPGYPSDLEKLEREARKAQVPIIRRETQSFLRMQLAAKQPRRILEVGTAIGFSTLLMCEYSPRDCQIKTIENYGPHIAAAKENFRKYDCQRKIHLLQGDASELLPEMDDVFELIFMDAAKGQYIRWLPHAVRLLAPGGILLSDNVLQEGEIAESRFLVERRNRTIHKRMREYLYELTHHQKLHTCVLPLGDGLAVSVKKIEEES